MPRGRGKEKKPAKKREKAPPKQRTSASMERKDAISRAASIVGGKRGPMIDIPVPDKFVARRRGIASIYVPRNMAELHAIQPHLEQARARRDPVRDAPLRQRADDPQFATPKPKGQRDYHMMGQYRERYIHQLPRSQGIIYERNWKLTGVE